MKIPEPVQKPNGKWIVRVMVDGKRKAKEFWDYADALTWAASLKSGAQQLKADPTSMTLGAAIDSYIELKNGVLSPSTVTGYRNIRANAFPELMNTSIKDLTRDKLQLAISKMSKEKSPKSVSNAYGLVTAALGMYAPDLNFRVTLPQKKRVDIVVPSEADIIAIKGAVAGTTAELPTMLAMMLGLRMSEIRGLKWSDYKGGYLHIQRALIDEGLKTTKTFNSNRVLHVPEQLQILLDKADHSSEFIVPMTRRAIHSRFEYYIKKAGVETHYRFHDLRHVNASVMLLLNIPDQYAMKRMGHATPNMLKTVYQHTMSAEERRVNSAVESYFDNLFS